MTAEVELVHDSDCPNAAKARINLRSALRKAGIPARWREWVRTAPDTPPERRLFGSPTILVNGRDVTGSTPLDGTGACRIYPGEGGSGVPSISLLLAALRAAQGTGEVPRSFAGFLSSFAALPGIAAALLPALACPACWPAYAGLLSSFGVGVLWNARYLLPLNAALLGIALAALAIGARRRRGYGPLLLGSVGSAGVILAKFFLDRAAIVYAAAGLLLLASVWNAWPKSSTRPCCRSCEPPTGGNSSAVNSHGGS